VTNATLPPMQYVDPSGKIIGMRIDMANAIAQRLCLKLDVVNAQFDSQIPGLQGHRWDMIDTGMFYTPERAKTIKLVPYEVQGVAISVQKGNPKNIHSVDDLNGHSVAAEVPGYEYDTLVALQKKLKAEGKQGFTIRGFQTVADGYQALQSGQTDAMAIVQAVTTYYEKSGNFDTAVSGLNKAPLALGFSDEGLAKEVATALNDLKTDGTLQKLFDKYHAALYSGPIAVSTGTLPGQS
jgi:polar amino acid transport system substrate-binding protein